MWLLGMFLKFIPEVLQHVSISVFCHFFIQGTYSHYVLQMGSRDATTSVPLATGTAGSADHHNRTPLLFITPNFDTVLIFILYIHSSVGHWVVFTLGLL